MSATDSPDAYKDKQAALVKIFCDSLRFILDIILTNEPRVEDIVAIKAKFRTVMVSFLAEEDDNKIKLYNALSDILIMEVRLQAQSITAFTKNASDPEPKVYDPVHGFNLTGVDEDLKTLLLDQELTGKRSTDEEINSAFSRFEAEKFQPIQVAIRELITALNQNGFAPARVSEVVSRYAELMKAHVFPETSLGLNSVFLLALFDDIHTLNANLDQVNSQSDRESELEIWMENFADRSEEMYSKIKALPQEEGTFAWRKATIGIETGTQPNALDFNTNSDINADQPKDKPEIPTHILSKAAVMIKESSPIQYEALPLTPTPPDNIYLRVNEGITVVEDADCLEEDESLDLDGLISYLSALRSSDETKSELAANFGSSSQLSSESLEVNPSSERQESSKKEPEVVPANVGSVLVMPVLVDAKRTKPSIPANIPVLSMTNASHFYILPPTAEKASTVFVMPETLSKVKPHASPLPNSAQA